MDNSTLKTLFTRLGRNAFSAYILDHFRDYYTPEHFSDLKGSVGGIYKRDLPDYVAPPEEGSEEHYGIFEAAYIAHYFPTFHDATSLDVNDPGLESQIIAVRDYYSKQQGWIDLMGVLQPKLQSAFLISNIAGLSKEVYIDEIIPRYKSLFRDNGLMVRDLGVGNFDSFSDFVPEQFNKSMQNFFSKNADGVRIEISDSRACVDSYLSEKSLVLQGQTSGSSPYDPVAVFKPTEKEELLKTFENIINKETRESVLEEFLTEHYQDIFGYHYDRIEPQLWLKFPDLDVSGKNRRMDLFLRNSITSDWELFEIKRIINVNRTYRDVPTLTSEIFSAIQQVKNYSRSLSQDKVKRHFAQKGIEYYEPTLQLVVGKTPQISIEQWRWLVASNNAVRIITFDELLKEMEIRMNHPLIRMGKAHG